MKYEVTMTALLGKEADDHKFPKAALAQKISCRPDQPLWAKLYRTTCRIQHTTDKLTFNFVLAQLALWGIASVGR